MNFLFKKMYNNEIVVKELNQNILMIEKLFYFSLMIQ